MTQTFTPNDILFEHSGELSKEEAALLHLAISESETLSDFEQSLSQLENQSQNLIMDPSDLPFQGIMKFVAGIADGSIDLGKDLHFPDTLR